MIENWSEKIKELSDSWGAGSEKHCAALENARALARESKFEDALTAYSKLFEEGRDTSPFIGARLSYVLSDMAELGKVYEPALRALLNFREAHEQSIRLGQSDDLVREEWTALCQYTDVNRQIEFYDSLESEPNKNEEVVTIVRRIIWHELIERKRYDEFSPSELATFLKAIAQYAGPTLSPNSILKKAMPEMLDFPDFSESIAKQTIQQCAAIYECAIGLNKQSIAKKALKLATYYERTGRAYSFFVNAAYRAGNNSNAQKLIDEAKSTLPENEFKTLMYTAEKLGLEP